MLHYKAACLVLTCYNDENLRILSVSRKTDPNAIGLPGGGIEQDETPLQAAIRETYEETGITINPNRCVPIYEAIDSTGIGVITYLHMGSLDAVAVSKEQGIVRWVEPIELWTTGPFVEYNKMVLVEMYRRVFSWHPQLGRLVNP